MNIFGAAGKMACMGRRASLLTVSAALAVSISMHCTPGLWIPGTGLEFWAAAATRPIASRPASSAIERMRDLEQIAREVARIINEAAWREPVVQHFAARYRELLGV